MTHRYIRQGKHMCGTHTTNHSGCPSCSFPPDAKATGTISCPLSPSLRAAPSFLDKPHFRKRPGLTSAPAAPLYNNLAHLHRPDLIAQDTLTQTESHTTIQHNHAQSSLILQVHFWLQWFIESFSIPFKAHFLSVLAECEQTG